MSHHESPHLESLNHSKSHAPPNESARVSETLRFSKAGCLLKHADNCRQAIEVVRGVRRLGRRSRSLQSLECPPIGSSSMACQVPHPAGRQPAREQSSLACAAYGRDVSNENGRTSRRVDECRCTVNKRPDMAEGPEASQTEAGRWRAVAAGPVTCRLCRLEAACSFLLCFTALSVARLAIFHHISQQAVVLGRALTDPGEVRMPWGWTPAIGQLDKVLWCDGGDM
jgi:hypothetical protein